MSTSLILWMIHGDLAEFEDAEELFVHLTEGGARGGESSIFPGQERSRKDTPGDDGHFVTFVRDQMYSSKEIYPPTYTDVTHSIEIDGEVYSLTRAPSSESRIVLEEQKQFQESFDFEALVRHSKDSPCFIRLARYAVAGNTKFEAQIDNIHSMVISAIHKSNKSLQEIGNGSILGALADGVNLAFRGNERDGSLTRLKEVRTMTKDLMTRASELIESLECNHQSITSVNRSIIKEHSRQSRHGRWNASSGETLRYADTALKYIDDACTNPYIWFWRNMNHWLETMAQTQILEMLEAMEEDKHKHGKIVHSKTFKTQLVKYYAKWVALQQVCSTLRDDLDPVEDDLVSSLTDRPSVAEARRKLPKLQRELDDKMRMKGTE